MASLAIKPKYQQHEIAKKLGYQYATILESKTYYPKTGYIEAKNLRIEIFLLKKFMAIKLQEDAKPIKGKVIYAKEFGM